MHLAGVGPKLAATLGAAGLHTVRDLLWFFPRRHDLIETIDAPCADAVDAQVRFSCEVVSTSLRFLPGRRSLLTVRVAADDGVPCDVVFFNQPYLKNTWAAGCKRIAEGMLRQRGARFTLSPGRLHAPGTVPAGPVQVRYPELEGISEPRLRKLIAQALARVDLATWPAEALPASLASEVLPCEDMPFAAALVAMHAPTDVEAHERARRYFAILEATRLFAVMERARRRRLAARGPRVSFSPELEARIAARIPFAWTDDQAAAVARVRAGLGSGSPLGLLLQGDVGTGKTAVAVFAALAVVAAQMQVAFLAPTELLAEQHFAGIARWLAGSRVRARLLSSSLGRAERDEVEAEVSSGECQWVFGTHALFSATTRFANLGLVIVDEQHRFGVEQRQALVHKGRRPHLLVLTATPIPRTLALALFGDLDVAVLRQRPPGARTAPALAVRGGWPRVFTSMTRRVRRGGGVFVVCPSIGEDGEKGGAVAVHAGLSRRFPCGLVHGRLPVAERQEVVRRFRAGDFQVLVGTTVLEVGVDIPRATLMVIAGAERFGLATLHQLRGRVGRGARRGLCLVLGASNPRTQALCSTTDGFALAELDLRLRGAGELLGLRQSGSGELRALDPFRDLELLLRVRAAVGASPPGAEPVIASPVVARAVAPSPGVAE